MDATVATNDMTSALDPWGTLWLVIQVVLPPVVFGFIFSFIVYVLFVVLLSRLSAAFGSKAAMAPAGAVLSVDKEASTAPAPVDFGYLLGPSYVVMASLFGVVLGTLVRLVGGFSGLASQAPANSLLGAIAGALIVIVGVAGSLFVDTGNIALRRPVGAIAFLATFLVTGIYWQYLFPH